MELVVAIAKAINRSKCNNIDVLTEIKVLGFLLHVFIVFMYCSYNCVNVWWYISYIRFNAYLNTLRTPFRC
jgi:hypothetical protein